MFIENNIGIDMSRGKVGRYTPWNAMGEREAMGNPATGEDIWRGNELDAAPADDAVVPIPSSAGQAFSFFSESTNDKLGGTGVNTLRAEMLDVAGDMVSEDIIMDGTTVVSTTRSDLIFINDMYALTVGNIGVSSGHIVCHKFGTANLVYNMIAAGGNKSLVLNRMVPAGHDLVVVGWHCGEAQGKRIAFRIRSTDMQGVLIPGVYCFKDTCYVWKNPSGWLPLNFTAPALSVVKVSAWPDQTAAEAHASWNGYLIG